MHSNIKEGIVADKKVDKDLRRIVDLIVEKYSPAKIYLFGSYARGDYHDGSDLDLAIIGDFKERFTDRIGKILELNDTDQEIEPVVYTEPEFSRMERRENQFIANIKKGNLIYVS